ncbi:hypothetical protein HK405_011905, partial [Cladochytrium tenue]
MVTPLYFSGPTNTSPRTRLLSFLADIFGAAIDMFIPVLIQSMIEYMGDPTSSQKKPLLIQSPWGLTAAIFVLVVFRCVLAAVSDQEINVVQFQVKTALTGLIYEKALALSYKASLELSEMVSIVFLLNFMMGRVIMSTVIALVAALVLVGALLPSMEKYQGLVLHYGDERIRIIREVLMGIKIIKLRANDLHFQKVIDGIRGVQMRHLVVFLAILGVLAFLLTLAPIGLPLFLLAPYRKLTIPIDAATIFPALSYFRMLYVPLRHLPQDAMIIVQGITSWNRIRRFLAAEEIHTTVRQTVDPDSKVAVEIKDGSFVWETLESAPGSKPGETITIPVFDGLNLTIQKGSLVAIVGSVGSGKSSLISALTSEMKQTGGTVVTNGKVALCQQQPWLMSKTILDNIVFGLPMVPSKLSATIKACGLEHDIEQLEKGIRTVIGDNSITLSGGQRSRVALARAVYYNADIYLLDDPLASLDSRAGRHVFEECIRGVLGSKTRLLVTHQLQYLPQVDHIVVMDKGRVVEQGSFEDLMGAGGRLALMMRDFNYKQEQAAADGEPDESPAAAVVEASAPPSRRLPVPADDDGDDLIADEDRERG